MRAQVPQIFPSMDSRYPAATLEKCSRIQSRQLIQLTYVTVLATLVAAMLSGKFDLTSGNYLALILAVGIPCFASIIAAWSGNQDSLIALLDSFCYRIEEFGAIASNYQNLPRWYDAKDAWFAESLIGRYWSNVAFGGALFGASLPGTILVYTAGHSVLAVSCQIALVLPSSFTDGSA